MTDVNLKPTINKVVIIIIITWHHKKMEEIIRILSLYAIWLFCTKD